MAGDFGAAVGRLRAAMDASHDDGDAAWARPRVNRPSPELAGRRQMGREAYERAMRQRGASMQEARICASAYWLFQDQDPQAVAQLLAERPAGHRFF